MYVIPPNQALPIIFLLGVFFFYFSMRLLQRYALRQPNARSSRRKQMAQSDGIALVAVARIIADGAPIIRERYRA